MYHAARLRGDLLISLPSGVESSNCIAFGAPEASSSSGEEENGSGTPVAVVWKPRGAFYKRDTRSREDEICFRPRLEK